MSDRLSMKFTASNSVKKIAPVMKIAKKAAPTPQPTSIQQYVVDGGKPASAWRAAYGGGGESFSLKKGCGCGGGG